MSESVVHLLARDVARGAQAYAAEVCDRLDSESWRHEVLTVFDAGEETSRFRSLGLPAASRPPSGIQWRALRPLRNYLVNNGATMVVAHGSEPLLYALLAAPRSVAVVYYRIGISGDSLASPIRRKLYQLLVRRCPLVMGVSQETLDDSQRVFGVNPDRLRLVPNGRDPAPFESLSTSSRGNAPVRLLWVSHMTSHKRPEWFVSLIAQLRQRGLSVEGVMVGDGPLLDELLAAELIADLQLLGRRDDVPELMASSDIFCFTSEGENEGMPGVLIEAGMAGLPTVSTRVAGASTVIDHGVTGLLAGCDDLEGVIEAAASLVVDAGRRRQLGDAAARRCHELFTLDASAASLQGALHELA